MGCSPATSFAWTGFILFNIGLGTLTIWGVLSNWILGLSICCAYALLLFILSYWSEKKNLSYGAQEDEKKIDFKLFVHLLYALAVLTMSVAGLILALNVINCAPIDTFRDIENSGWEIDMSTIPKDVQSWAKNYDFKGFVETTFKYFPASGVSLFRGNDGMSEVGFPGYTSHKLWQSVEGKQPTFVDDMYDPFWFVSDEMSNTTCFIASKRLSIEQKEMWVETEYVRRVVCTNDGLDLRIIEEKVIRDPKNLFWNNGTLWVVGKSVQKQDDWGNIIFSVNPGSLEVQNHSRKKENAPPQETSCDNDNFRRKSAIATLFLSSLPLAAISLVLWVKKGIPTLPITTYVGVSASVVCLYVMAEFFEDGISDSFYIWWFGVTSAIWVLSLFFLSLVKKIKRDTLVWSLNFSSIVLLINAAAIFGIFRFRLGDEWWRWVLINMFVFIPLIMIGVICASAVVVLTGTAGLFMDVYKISDTFSKMNDYNNTIPIYFGVFAVSGITLGVVGWLVNKNQYDIQLRVSMFATKYFGSFIQSEQVQEDDDDIPVEVGIVKSQEDGV